MKRILVIGCPGSGKSYFSRTLAEKLGLPLVHLDMLNWNADGTNVEREVFDARLAEVLARDEWIIDGNYGRTMERRIEHCDTIFFLDFPTEVCLNGVRERTGKPRPDMPFDPSDAEDAEFMEFISRYNEESRPRVLELLEKHSDREIVVFRDRDEANAYLAKL